MAAKTKCTVLNSDNDTELTVNYFGIDLNAKQKDIAYEFAEKHEAFMCCALRCDINDLDEYVNKDDVLIVTSLFMGRYIEKLYEANVENIYVIDNVTNELSKIKFNVTVNYTKVKDESDS